MLAGTLQKRTWFEPKQLKPIKADMFGEADLRADETYQYARFETMSAQAQTNGPAWGERAKTEEGLQLLQQPSKLRPNSLTMYATKT